MTQSSEPSAPATLTSSSGHALLAKQWAQLAHREGFGSDRTVIDMIIGHVDELDAQLRAALKPSPSPVVVEPPDRESVMWRLHRFLDCAGGEGLELGGVDAGDLFMEIFEQGALEAKQVPWLTEEEHERWGAEQRARVALNPKRPEEGKS